MDSDALKKLRQEYSKSSLTESEVTSEPLDQFQKWFDEALEAKLHEPNAITVATATSDGHPSARVVLMKQFDESGFVFHTNYDGRKGRELSENPACALLFYWGELERQVRIEGIAERLPESESDAYFQTRPRGGHIGAWASRQSEPVENREALEEEVRRIESEYDGRDVPRPPFWGGFRVAPQSFEFWQGRENRLHDRILYTRNAAGKWKIIRLQP